MHIAQIRCALSDFRMLPHRPVITSIAAANGKKQAFLVLLFQATYVELSRRMIDCMHAGMIDGTYFLLELYCTVQEGSRFYMLRPLT